MSLYIKYIKLTLYLHKIHKLHKLSIAFEYQFIYDKGESLTHTLHKHKHTQKSSAGRAIKINN